MAKRPTLAQELGTHGGFGLARQARRVIAQAEPDVAEPDAMTFMQIQLSKADKARLKGAMIRRGFGVQESLVMAVNMLMESWDEHQVEDVGAKR